MQILFRYVFCYMGGETPPPPPTLPPLGRFAPSHLFSKYFLFGFFEVRNHLPPPPHFWRHIYATGRIKSIFNQLCMRNLEMIDGNYKKLWPKNNIFTSPSKLLNFRNSPFAKNIQLQLEIENRKMKYTCSIILIGLVLPCVQGFLMDRYF